MCQEAGRLENGQMIGCRKCKQCKDNYRQDWEGRCIAESRTARKAHFVTLTYGRAYDGETRLPVKLPYHLGESDHVRAAVLTYKDVQDFFKRLREQGHAFRYFVAGEYGSLKGRSHWHILMYWQSVPPKVVLNARIDFEPWGHGFVEFAPMTIRDIRYCVKYVQKGNANDMQSYFSPSKRPALGTWYFKQLAARYVDQGLAPQDLFYSFAESRKKDGSLIRYRMKGGVAEKFIADWKEAWAKKYPGKHEPWSELVEDYSDRAFRKQEEVKFDLSEELKRLASKPVGRRPERPKRVPPGVDRQVYWSESRRLWVADNGNDPVLYWSYSEDGVLEWTETIRSESEGDAKRMQNEVRRLASSDNQNEYRRKSAIHDEPIARPFKRRRG